MTKRQRALARAVVAILASAALRGEGQAQLDSSCVVSALNRSARVQADGTWVLTNVPSTQGLTRVRATYVADGVTRVGQSGLIAIPPNGVIAVTDIDFNVVQPIPQKLTLTPPAATLSAVGATVQLQATATYPDGTVRDVTAGDSGTDYRRRARLCAGDSAGLGDLPWGRPEASGEHLLDRRIDVFSFIDVNVEDAIAQLCDKANLPLSFIQADPEPRVSLTLRGATVRQILDAIVARAPVYRYGFLAGRLVLYPRDPKWEMRVNNLSLGPAPRARLAKDLATELSRRLPAFADLCGPWILGDPRSYAYQDAVTVTGPGSVLELLIQLLGNRPSSYLLVVKEDGWVCSSLSVSARGQLQALKLTAPTTILQRRGETLQLKLIGTLAYDGSAKDLTSRACGTAYRTSDERVLTVSPDGLVTVHGSGKAEVEASNEHYSDSVIFDCHVEGQ